MEKVLEIRAYLLKFYAKYSRYVDMTFRFVLALLTFTFINNHIGYLEVISNAAVTIGLSVICVFLPTAMTAVLAGIIVLIQFFTLAPGVAIVAGLLMIIMFASYFRFSPGKGTVLLMTPVAFSMNVPILIPIVFGMVGGPTCAIPIAFGTIVYYMITYVKSYATLIETVAESGMMGQITSFTQQLFANREMWMTIISFTVCLLVVYNIRRMSIDYAWEIAAITGALVNLLMMTFGYVIMDVDLDVQVIPSSIIAVAIAIVVKIFVFSVNYARSEYLQFEDDEYYYYVKAIPKVSMAVREKTVKKINVRQETEVIDVDSIKNKLNEVELKSDRDEKIESEIQKIIEEELNR